MARKSMSDLVVVPLPGGGRPPPPADLDAVEQSIWKAVVDASPAYAIDPAAQLILKRLVAQAALCEQREAHLRTLRAERPDNDEELTALATAHGNGAKVVTFLLTSLRSTPRSRVRLGAAETQASRVPVTRPWERKPVA
jgi:hypothetical protein